MAWKIGKSGIYDLQPGKNVKFFDYLGNNIARPQGSANGLLLTTEPIYWQE
jgi:hypothetical protein